MGRRGGYREPNSAHSGPAIWEMYEVLIPFFFLLQSWGVRDSCTRSILRSGADNSNLEVTITESIVFPSLAASCSNDPLGFRCVGPTISEGSFPTFSNPDHNNPTSLSRTSIVQAS